MDTTVHVKHEKIKHTKMMLEKSDEIETVLNFIF